MISAITKQTQDLGRSRWRSRKPGGCRFSTRCIAGSRICSTPARAAANASRRARWSSRPGSTRKTRSAIVGGVLDLLAGGAGTQDAERWAQVCTNSGKCIPACDYGINPRFMVNMARIAAKAKLGDDAVRRGAQRIFHLDGRSTRIDLASAAAAGNAGADQPAAARRRRIRRRAPDIVFYTGCNVIKTPHIALLVLEVLDALGVQLRGDGRQRGVLRHPAVQAGRRQDRGTGRRSTRSSGWRRPGASRVIAWCPSCQIQIGEVAMPAYANRSARCRST